MLYKCVGQRLEPTSKLATELLSRESLCMQLLDLCLLSSSAATPGLAHLMHLVIHAALLLSQSFTGFVMHDTLC